MHRSWAPRTVAPKVGDGALPHCRFRTRPTSLQAALYTHPPQARPSLLALASLALRGAVGGASMTTPGGAGTPFPSALQLLRVLVAPASIMGSEFPQFSWLNLLGSGPFALPRPDPISLCCVRGHNPMHRPPTRPSEAVEASRGRWGSVLLGVWFVAAIRGAFSPLSRESDVIRCVLDTTSSGD